MRDWDYGVLLLSPTDARGLDTRFRKDSHVLVLAQVQTYHELQQMIGRSSRTRGVCQGSLFLISDERGGKVLERLKLQGVVSIQGLEKLIFVLEKRAKDGNFIRLLQELKENKIVIKTYEDLKRNIDEKIFDKYIKDVFI